MGCKKRLIKNHTGKICFDEMTDRVYGTTKISVNCDKDIDDLKEGQEVNFLIHSFSKIGDHTPNYSNRTTNVCFKQLS